MPEREGRTTKHNYELDKTGSSYSTFYEPRELPEGLRQNLRILGMVYAADSAPQTPVEPPPSNT